MMLSWNWSRKWFSAENWSLEISAENDFQLKTAENQICVTPWGACECVTGYMDYYFRTLVSQFWPSKNGKWLQLLDRRLSHAWWYGLSRWLDKACSLQRRRQRVPFQITITDKRIGFCATIREEYVAFTCKQIMLVSRIREEWDGQNCDNSW